MWLTVGAALIWLVLMTCATRVSSAPKAQDEPVPVLWSDAAPSAPDASPPAMKAGAAPPSLIPAPSISYLGNESLGPVAVVLGYGSVYDVHVAPDPTNYPNMRIQPGGFDVGTILAHLELAVDPSVYDFVLMYSLHEVPGWINSGGRFSFPAMNIGFANSLYGSLSPPAPWTRLRSVPHMNSVEFIARPAGGLDPWGALTSFHEIFHYWGVYITVNQVGPREWLPGDPVGWLASCCAHWTWVWDEEGMPGIMYSGPTSDRFNAFDLYMMGLMGYAEASQVTHVLYEDESDPRVLHDVALDDLIYALSLAGPTRYEGDGLRMPATDPAVQDLKALIVVIKGVDETLTAEDADLVLDLANDMAAAWYTATWGRSSMDVQVVPEPSTIVLRLSAIGLLMGLARMLRPSLREDRPRDGAGTVEVGETDPESTSRLRPELVPQQVVSVEQRPALERQVSEHPRHPEAIVRPHPVVGDVVDVRPERHGLFRLADLPAVSRRREHGHVDAEAVCELKRELARPTHVERFDAYLFARLAQRAGQRAFSGLDPTPGTVHLARAEPALLLDQQDFVAAPHEQQRRAFIGLPARPVDGLERGRPAVDRDPPTAHPRIFSRPVRERKRGAGRAGLQARSPWSAVGRAPSGQARGPQALAEALGLPGEEEVRPGGLEPWRDLCRRPSLAQSLLKALDELRIRSRQSDRPSGL